MSGDEALIQAFERGAGHPPRHGGEDLRRRSGPRQPRDALRGQAHQLRPALRHGGLHARQGARRARPRRRRATSTPTSPSFPSVRACLDGILDEARRTTEVTTLFGRVRPIPDIAASNAAVRANAERMALNAPFQGTAADIIKIAMIRLDAALARGRARRRGSSSRSTTSSSSRLPTKRCPRSSGWCGR